MAGIQLVQSEEVVYDRIFNAPQYNGVIYQTIVNGTIYETQNFKQFVFYNWSDLSENAKRIVNATMIDNGYPTSMRAEQTHGFRYGE